MSEFFAPAPGAHRRVALVPRWLRILAVAAGVTALASCSVLHAVTRQQDRREARVPAGRYVIDPRHSSVVFSVDHLGFSDFTLRFDQVAGQLDWPAGGISAARVRARVATASVDSNDPALDAQLRSPAMLDAARQPFIDWVGSGWRPTAPGRGDVQGMLTLGRSSEPLRLHARFNGYGVDPITGKPTLGFSATGEFSRAGLDLRAWPGFVGDTVRVRIEVEFVAAAP